MLNVELRSGRSTVSTEMSSPSWRTERDMLWSDKFHVFLSRVQQTVSGSKPSQYPLDTIRWTLFRCSTHRHAHALSPSYEILLRSRWPGRGVKSCPGSKGQKRVSGGVSEGSRPTPQRVKDESAEDCEAKFVCLASPETHFCWEIKSAYRYRLEGCLFSFRPPWSI